MFVPKFINLTATGLLLHCLSYMTLSAKVCGRMTTVHAARAVLNKQRLAIVEMHEDGLLEEREAKTMQKAIETSMKRLLFHPPKVKIPHKLELLREVDWLKGLDHASFDQLVDVCSSHVFNTGDLICKQVCILLSFVRSLSLFSKFEFILVPGLLRPFRARKATKYW